MNFALNTPVETTLGEQLLLLSLDDESGAEKQAANVAYAIAAASLVELALAGRVEVHDDQVTVRDAAPLGDPTLDAALADLSGDQKRKPRRTKEWIEHLKKGAVAGTTKSLVGKGLLREEKKKVLGLFPVRRYPEADGSVEAALRQRLDEVVMRGADPDERTASLVALLHGAKLHGLLYQKPQLATARTNMEKIAHGQWAGPAVRQAVKAAEDALTAIVVVTVVTTTVL
ncbi:GOLPH3/VPS74 family protein [Streptomyces sp. NBC_01716]|uniref:GOLPH3/VPS74 family protein n=1 Tax=Streptomyces sp. NBC_01716 TaxID=2975917 RepID=UPI002E338632|nr:GPP34 family phosphoprotein [Streptomyces sp. NBC_01716]